MTSKQFTQLDNKLKNIQDELSNHIKQYHPDSPQKLQSAPRKHREYTVTSDDHSLSLIAKKLSSNAGRYTEMAALNGIVHPFTIHSGQVLLIPPTW